MKLLEISAAVAAVLQSASAVTIYMAGDSTMAKNGGGSGTDGWGQYIGHSITGATVSNQAVGGRSARSYTREGRFTTIINSVKAGDFVIIEFGHNDGGSLSTSDNGRTDCGGTGDETCHTTYNGVSETVLTFPKYLTNAAASIKAKGANVIISSQTPNNPFESGTFTYGPSRFVGYAQTAASRANVPYIDHGQYVANIYRTKGLKTVDSYFPNDHTHTAPAGADTVAKAFVKAVLCGGLDLAHYIKNSTSSVEGACV